MESSFVFHISHGFFVRNYTLQDKNRKYVILMISDGYGPASQTFARSFNQALHKDAELLLPLDTMLVGSSRTKSSSSLITDSAAGATAFSCAIKTYNGAIGVEPNKKPCITVLEAAKKAGYATGLVSTSRVTHATPASFSAHVEHRDMESEIALFQMGFSKLNQTVDLLMGGGRCMFVSGKDSCRRDNINLLVKRSSATLAFSRAELSSIESIHQDNSQPSLMEMASFALKNLMEASDKGFFLMIEGSRIDMAAHSNDPATHAREILMYQQTVELVKDFVDKNPGAVMISVSDHETGGLTVGAQYTEEYPEYKWNPQILLDINKSTSRISKEIKENISDNMNSDSIEIYLKIVIKAYLPFELEKVELDYLKKHVLNNDYSKISKRANIGWTTYGHTGVDVNLYAYGRNSEALRGSRENTEIGRFVLDSLGIHKEHKLMQQRI
ncbi:alkaline phosphatase-like protein, partial [Rozella allomycis CSF55]